MTGEDTRQTLHGLSRIINQREIIEIHKETERTEEVILTEEEKTYGDDEVQQLVDALDH